MGAPCELFNSDDDSATFPPSSPAPSTWQPSRKTGLRTCEGGDPGIFLNPLRPWLKVFSSAQKCSSLNCSFQEWSWMISQCSGCLYLRDKQFWASFGASFSCIYARSPFHIAAFIDRTLRNLRKSSGFLQEQLRLLFLSVCFIAIATNISSPYVHTHPCLFPSMSFSELEYISNSTCYLILLQVSQCSSFKFMLHAWSQLSLTSHHTRHLAK